MGKLFMAAVNDAEVSCHLPRLVREAEPGSDAQVAGLVQELELLPGPGPRMSAFDDDFRTTSDAGHPPEEPVRADQAELVNLGLHEF